MSPADTLTTHALAAPKAAKSKVPARQVKTERSEARPVHAQREAKRLGYAQAR